MALSALGWWQGGDWSQAALSGLRALFQPQLICEQFVQQHQLCLSSQLTKHFRRMYLFISVFLVTGRMALQNCTKLHHSAPLSDIPSPSGATWFLTELKHWKIRLHFSMLIAIYPKQCNQGLMCSYNFILDISLTAIYCWSELWGGEEKNSCNFPSPPKQHNSFAVWSRIFVNHTKWE